MAKIIIQRKSSFAGSAQNHDVYLFNTFVGELKNGGMLEIAVDVGIHTLYFRSKLKKLGKNAVFNVTVNQETEVVLISTRFNGNGEYVVEYADNAPHVPTFSNSTTEPLPSDSADAPHVTTSPTLDKGESGVRCPRCGSFNLVPISEASTKGKNFKVCDACCGWLLCGPIGLLCGATGKGKQLTTTTYWLCHGCGNKFKIQ